MRDAVTKRRLSSSFEFVNLSGCSKTIDKAVRTTIRRHAKLHQSQQERKQGDIPKDVLTLQDPILEETEDLVPTMVARINLQQIPGVDPFDQSPIQLEPYVSPHYGFYISSCY